MEALGIRERKTNRPQGEEESAEVEDALSPVAPEATISASPPVGPILPLYTALALSYAQTVGVED